MLKESKPEIILIHSNKNPAELKVEENEAGRVEKYENSIEPSISRTFLCHNKRI